MDFSGFSPDSFEQLTQALALKVLGPGVSIFGNGPDGGREATFNGKINFPYPPNEQWQGYGVIQAKFKEKSETTQKDQSWAIKQLEHELSLWEDNDNRDPKPDYFIYCTNVELSAATNGGIDKVNALLEGYRLSLGLKGFDVWDANKLAALVDGQEDIRKRFTNFFTSGDLLAAFASQLTEAPDAEAILTTYLCNEIEYDADARLSQAGDKTDDRIKLADVFIDLPTGEQTPDEEVPANTINQLLRWASFKLDPKALYEHNSNWVDGAAKLFNRFVFLGGPGSGKSTIGQFMSQIHRAALLSRRPEYQLKSKVLRIIESTKMRCEQEQFAWPTTPRYPFRIDLNDFAKALATTPANDGVKTLSEYLRNKLSKNDQISHQTLKAWLKAYPWLLIFDGLDEVPTSSNRTDVIAEIQSFLNDAQFVGADIMIVGTSRPDGYSGEFGEDEIVHNHLSPLPPALALSCAQRYVSAKYTSKEDPRATGAMKILREAIDNPLVAKLMHSPLQVTFMVTVVTAGGKPSKSRWQLFKDYYDTIYAREQQKAVLPFYGVLNEHKPEIDTLHHEVGFILQCRAEQSGETQADMSIAEFEKMVVNYLQENGLEAANLIEQKNLILGAANERLVFLTSRKKDRLSFEVRSLQEYMAAACITAVDSSEIITRLKIIAHSAYWRNTLLFAIGRFFVDADLRKYRDKIRLLCTDLNRETPQNEACKLGSRLALEILESGSINSTPTFIRHLADGALELLSFAPTSNNNITKRLADIFTPAMQSEYEENIKRWIGLSDQHLTLSAWMLLLYLEESQHAWAAKIVDKNWPDDANHAWLILKTWIFDIREKRGKIKVNHLEVARLEKTIPALSIYDTNWPEFCEKIAPRSLKDSWLHTVIYNRNSHLRIELKNGSKETGMKFRITKIPFDIDKETFNSLFQSCKQKDTHSSWLVLMSIIEFELELDISSLVNALNNIAKNSNSSEWRHWAALSPWPIAYCLNSSSSIFELQEFINKTHNGQLGNVEDWKKIQEAWLENDLELADAFKGFLDEQFSIAFLCSRLATTMTDPKSAMEHSTSLLQQIINSAGEQLGRLPELVEFHATCNQALHLLNPIDLLTYILPCENYLYSNGFLIDQEDPLDNSNDWLKLYDAIGLSDDLKFSPWLDLFPPIDFLLKAYLRDTSRTGLLRLAGFWCAAGASPTINLSTLQPIENYESAQERLAVMILKMSQQDSTDDQTQEIIGHLDGITANTAVPDAKPALLSMIKENSTKIPALTAILHALMTTFTSDEWEMRAESMDSYSAMIQAASSGFDNSLAAKLDLPAVELANNFSLD